MNQIRNNNNSPKSLVRFMPIAIVSISVIIIIIFSAYNGISILAYTTSNSTVLRNSTNASSLEVLLVPLSNVSREEMHFRVGFLQPETNELQRHVDFNFIIMKDGKEVFSASNQTGQPQIPLHSIRGTMDIPLFTYDFEKTGEYTIKIPVFGILFNPIIPEEAKFRIEY
ncbi:MAG: hypothetical protein GEU26_15890 [Nitrososphaeraceae archaeon]|nr:hypothetical protein [Nitrososphaeraceae archaeon]